MAHFRAHSVMLFVVSKQFFVIVSRFLSESQSILEKKALLHTMKEKKVSKTFFSENDFFSLLCAKKIAMEFSRYSFYF